jgi:hypothetical protein
LKQFKTPEDRESFLLDLIESPFRKAQLMQLVKETCGLTEQNLETILSELRATVLTRVGVCTVDEIYAVAYRLHRDLKLTDICVLNCRGHKEWQSTHFRKTLRHLVSLARAHNDLNGFSPGFFERHTTETVRRLALDNSERYGWLVNCVVVDCTDELIESTSDPHVRNITWGAKPKTSHNAVTYLRAHMHDMYALWTSDGYPPNNFHLEGQPCFSTER